MNNIATLRKQREMTQTDLAAQIGISQGTLSQYESGKRTPDSKTLIKLSEFFNCTPNYILGLPEEKSINIDVSKLSMTDVTAITEVASFKQANVCLRIGWRLLHISEEFVRYEDGSGHGKVVYVLGWFGDPANAEVPDDPAREPRDFFEHW